MNKSLRSISLLLLCLVSLSLLASSCDLLKKGGAGKQEGVQLPSMETAAEGASVKKDSRGLSDNDEEWRVFGRDKLNRFLKAFEDFGSQMNDFLPKVMNDGAIVTDVKSFVDARTELIKACRGIEAAKIDQSPEIFRNYFSQLFLLANRSRSVLAQVLMHNATCLPAAYDDVRPLVQDFSQKAESFFATIDSKGAEAAVGMIPPVDWAAESARNPEIRSVFNVADLGLVWGSSRADVMGVEGLIEGAYGKDVLSYQCSVYLYKGTRSYHFNEHDQMDSYSYDLDTGSHDNTAGVNDVYDDLYTISPVLMYGFVLETPAVPVYPQDMGNGLQGMTFDQNAETVVMTGDVNDPAKPIHIEITGKKVQ